MIIGIFGAGAVTGMAAKGLGLIEASAVRASSTTVDDMGGAID